MLAVMFATVAQAVETNFSVSSLTASDVNCKKCHTDIPHIIHAPKPVSCENCHGDKKSVEIPKCTKCHDGPIHKVHEGKISQGCPYCHKNIEPVHTNFTSEAVCSHCHKDLIEVHGKDQSCTKCHRSPPEIVKPLKSPEMILVCQNCHPQTSVATIHGETTNKQGCYNCHKGTSQLNGSDVPHTIHQTKASCKDCHEDNGKVVVPQCIKCHDIDKLHAFNKIGKLTSTTLSCQVCHSGETNPVKTTKTADTKTTDIKATETKDKITEIKETTIAESQSKESPEETPQSLEEKLKKTPGFGILSGIIVLYLMRKIVR
jgi:hypothetical protein